MNFFLVDSPLQLLNAIEAQKYFNIKKGASNLIAFEGVSEKSFKQIQSLIKQEDWNAVFLIPKNDWKILRYKSLYRLNKIINGNNIDKVYIGDYRSNIMRHFINASQCQDSYLLDDGSASIFIHEKIDTGKGIREELGIGRKVAHWITNLKDDDIFNIKYFTIYGEKDKERVIRNNYRYIKSLVNEFERENVVYFLGNCLPELDIINVDNYLSSLNKVKDTYVGKQLCYIPHRRETPQKVRKIKKEVGFSVIDFDMPIEWALVKEGKLPYEVASFYSSALDNCHMIYGNIINIRSFKPDRNLIKEEVREKFDVIFRQYEEYGEGFYITKI